MQCSVCHSEVPDDAQFCQRCGARLKAVPEGINPAVIALVEQYERSVADRPKDADARFNLALAYLQANRYGSAVQQLELVRQMEPDFADVFYWLAIAYWRLENREAAKAALDELLKLNPNYPKADKLIKLLRR